MGLKQLIAGMSQDTQGAAGYTVPVGGLTSEVLSKASAADGDFAWLATSPGGDAQGDSGKLALFDPFGQLTSSTLNLTGYVIAGPSQQPARIVFGQDDWTVGSLTVQGPQAPFSPGADFILTLPHHGDGTFLLDTSPSYSGNAATATLAATVTTNANLTGHITSTGNATLLGSFTIAQLNAAVSDADVATLGANTFTGTQTLPGGATISASGGAVTITTVGTQNINLNAGSGIVTTNCNLTASSFKTCSFDTFTAAGGFRATAFGVYYGVLSSTRMIVNNGNIEFANASTTTWGELHATTPTAQKIKAHNVTTGTGASMTIAGGTGSTAGGSVILATSATTGAPVAWLTVKASGVINVAGIPTSSAGLVTGDLWSNGGVLTVV